MQNGVELQKEIHQMLKTFDARFVQPCIDLSSQTVVCERRRVRNLKR